MVLAGKASQEVQGTSDCSSRTPVFVRQLTDYAPARRAALFTLGFHTFAARPCVPRRSVLAKTGVARLQFSHPAESWLFNPEISQPIFRRLVLWVKKRILLQDRSRNYQLADTCWGNVIFRTRSTHAPIKLAVHGSGCKPFH